MKNSFIKIVSIVLFCGQIAFAQSAKTLIKGSNSSGGLNLAGETLVSGYSGSGYIDIWDVNYSTTNDKFIVSIFEFNRPNERAKTGILSFTKYKSKSSRVFHENLFSARKFDTMEIAFAKFIGASVNSYQTYLNYKCRDVYVLSIKDNNDFTETIELLVPQMYMDYKPTNPQTGLLGSSITYGWNFITNAAWNGN